MIKIRKISIVNALNREIFDAMGKVEKCEIRCIFVNENVCSPNLLLIIQIFV